jgi:hypothetical protein
MPPFHFATFRSDTTPPDGHPLCGGWIEPVRGVDDPLEALGVILLGMGRPIVLCAVDWCGLRNDANRLWRQALAEAAHTVPECVTVHCVHPHNAPFADVEAQKLIEAAKAPTSLDLKFFEQSVRRSAEAARASLADTRRWTHAGFGKAKVEQVASNRRVLGPDGKVKYTRTSATKNAAARAEPEGLIDPWLRTLSFWDGEQPLAALSYYATHPMSYYGDGRVSADFCGLARRKREADDPKVFQVYFNGCGGNVTAGKYNDGAKENRPVLRDRVYAGLAAAWRATERFAVDRFSWRAESVQLPPRSEPSFGAEASRKVLEDPKQTAARRNNVAFQLAWLARQERPIELTCLDLGRVQVLHLPGEPFVEYQLFAQDQRPDRDVCVAGYGDGGPGYIPTAHAYLEGGYEPTMALAGPGSEAILRKAIRQLLEAGAKK